MPHYEFECQNCQEIYEIYSLMAEKEKNIKKGKCPSCKSKKKTEIVGCPSFNFGNPVGSDRWNSDASGHDYRFKHQMDKPGGVRDQRKIAEERSHVGATPYKKINDLDNDKNWGKVK